MSDNHTIKRVFDPKRRALFLWLQYQTQTEQYRKLAEQIGITTLELNSICHTTFRERQKERQAIKLLKANPLAFRLVSTTEAKPTKTQHRKPCTDCPFARTALNGWLGGYTAEEFIARAHGEDWLECHCAPNQQCAGAAIYRANVCKSPRNPELLKLNADRTLVFVSAKEFAAHHDL